MSRSRGAARMAACVRRAGFMPLMCLMSLILQPVPENL